MSVHAVDPQVLLQAIATLPSTFRTKDVSEHRLVRAAHVSLTAHRNYHAFIGKALKQLVQLDHVGSGGKRGATWRKRGAAGGARGGFVDRPASSNPAGSSVVDQGLGPQAASDNALVSRLRLHQSWYRQAVLRVPFGTGPTASSSASYGNMLRPRDGAAGLNFLTPRIFEVAQRRMAQAGAVEPHRMLHNMLSSQPMCFNLFGELVDDLPLATALARALWGERVAEVTAVRLEYAPEPAAQYLNDRTAFDAFVEYRTPAGDLGFVGVETKLSEPFSQKRYDSPAYRRWMTPDGPWLETDGNAVTLVAHNQLWRDHLLAVSLLSHPDSPYAEGRLLVAHHPIDHGCARVVAGYRQLLRDEATFEVRTLGDIVCAWRSVGLQLPWLDAFSERYLELEQSAR